MHIEDIYELIEDVPEQVRKRYNEVRQLELDWQKHREHFNALREKLMSESKNLTAEEKLKVCTDIGKTYHLMKTIGQKKIRLTESAEKILRLIAEKVTKDQQQFKWDLEAENPGCTEAIEAGYVASLQAHHRRDHRMKQSVVDPSLFMDSYASSQHSRPPLMQRNNGMTTTFKNGRHGPPVKNKGRKNPNIRARGRPPKSDAFGFPSVKCDDEISQASSLRDEDSISNLLAEEDINDLHDIFPQMPSPPREMLDIIKDDGSMFAYEHDLSMPLHSPMNGHPKGFMHRSAREGSDSSFISAERKKRFSSDVSLHGRHRRLTTRVEEMLSEKREKDQRKRLHGRDDEPQYARTINFRNGDTMGDDDDDRDDEDSHTVWCICKKPSDGEMIYCENEKCRIQWFHFECIGLKQAPIGHWFCAECRRQRQEF